MADGSSTETVRVESLLRLVDSPLLCGIDRTVVRFLPCELEDGFWSSLGFGPAVDEFPDASVGRCGLRVVIAKCYPHDQFVGRDERCEPTAIVVR